MAKITLNQTELSLEQQISKSYQKLKKEFPEQEFNYIGKGGLNIIFSTKFRDKKIALRICKNDEILENSPVIKEKINLTHLKHPNLTRVYRRILNTGIMLLEYSGEVNFGQRFTNTNTILLKQNLIAYHKVMKAVEYLVSQNLVHMDLKDDNILFHRHSSNPKIIDYDTMRKIDSKEKYNKLFCTVGFTAPEVFTFGELNDKIDVFSLGPILYRLTQLKDVFKCRTTVYLLDDVYIEYGEYKEKLKEPINYKNIPLVKNKIIKELINDMVQEDIEKRIDIKQAIETFESAMPKDIRKELIYTD